MMVLGLLLLLAAAGLTLDVVVQNTTSMSVDAVGQTFTLDSGWFFVAGVATGAIGLIGLSMLMGGMARARRRRAGRAQSTSAMEDLQADRDRLAEQLHRERAGQTENRQTDRDRRVEQLDHDETGRAPAPRLERSRAARADEPAEIDLASDESRAESNSSRRGGVGDAEDRERGAADGREPVGSGRHGLFRRRDR